MAGSSIGLKAKLGVEADDQQIKKETNSLKKKLTDAAEMNMEADVSSLKTDIVKAIEDASSDAKWLPDIGGDKTTGATHNNIDQRMLKGRMEALGQDFPNIDGPDTSIRGPGNRGSGADRSGGLMGEALGGMKGAGGKFLKVGLAGAVGLGILSKVGSLADSSPRMVKVLDMMNRSIQMFARPLFDFVATFLEGSITDLLKMGVNFNKIYQEKGLMTAITNLPEIFFTRNGEASKAGTAGRVVGGLAGAIGGAKAGAWAGGAIGAGLGSIIPGAGTAAGGTAGALAGGAIGGTVGLIGGADIGEDFADRLANIEPSTWGESIKDAGSDFASGVEGLGKDIAEPIESAVDTLTEMDLQEYMSAIMSGIEMGWDAIKWTGSVGWDAIKWTGEVSWGALKWTGKVSWNAIKWTGSIAWDLISWNGKITWQAIAWTGSLLWDAIVWTGNLGWGAIEWVGNIGWDDINFVGSIDLGQYISKPDWMGGGGGNDGGGNSGNWWDVELADGGLVTRPTKALVGEAGPEKVTPYSEYLQTMEEARRQGAPSTTGGSGGGGSGSSTEAVVSALRDVRREIKNLETGGDVYLDGKRVGKRQAEANDRYRNSRTVTR